ncbi:MAG: hypothetical protein RQ966_12995 [Acetobacteraceae bacterium]|nr:hypothetical protein [Acetobacteraceae bacterium]
MPWLVAIAGTLLYHRYTIASGFDAVQADVGDSRYIAFMLEHWNTWAHGHARLGSPLIFWPVLGTLGYSDALAGMGVVHIALRAAGLGVFTAMNVQLVALSLAAFAATYWLLRRGFAVGIWPATAGAYFYAFCWPRFAELVHVQMQFTFVLPLMALLALEALRDGGALSRTGFALRAIGFVALLALTMATTAYYGEFAMLFLVLTAAPALLWRDARRSFARLLVRQWPGVLAAGAAGLLLAWPIALVYLPVMRQSGGRSWAELQTLLLRPTDLLWMGRENYAWGWLSARWPDRANANWAGKRLGVGLVASLVWLCACVWAAWTLVRFRPGPHAASNRRIAALAVLATAAVQLCSVHIGERSLWWFIWSGFPGMSGLRTIGRIQLVATLPMALAFALAVDAGARSRWRWAIAALVCVGAAEQAGTVQRYSARDAEALARRVTDAIPRTCRAAYVLAPANTVPDPPVITDPAQFDAAAYLRANPDVASGWKDTAWNHYDKLGRKEHRSLDPAVAAYRTGLMFFYNYTIPLGASLAGIPVVNGLSGWQPPGWALFDVFESDAPAKMAAWVSRHGLDANDVCVVRVPLSPAWLPTVEVNGAS